MVTTNEELEQIMGQKKTIRISGQDITLDPARFQFTEVTLSRFFDQEATWYDYFGRKLVEAEAESQHFDGKYDSIYAAKFAAIKQSEGCSDKLAESLTKCNPDVEKAKDESILAEAKACFVIVKFTSPL